ncbi:lichenicidin A2 family type 2 lantibiotic [Sporosarcina aquimarina]|uniref:Mersacidin family lantibiotic n=1 Tax=Sporosarcina aquimarina TaxID=114975 RepID=A0ABU4FW14_9BACL|nr:mersacidin family lantibiotic [Sporosarcina aquimarina]MDW0108894.1 mersacidin family lantibiotic [Sporosarcina aquimarina]
MTTKGYAGPTFEELSMEEMVAIQGSGDVSAETTPICATAATAAASSAACGWVGGGIATGVTIVLSIKHC